MQLSDYKMGIAVFLVLLVLLAVLNPQPPVLETSKQKSPEGKNYSIDGNPVFVKKTFSATGDSIAYENRGDEQVEFGVIDIIPQSAAGNSGEVFFSNAGTGEGKTDFFDNQEPPVLRHTTITLGPGEKFERKTESRRFTLFPISKKPIHVFSPKDLSEEEKKVLEPVLRKASSLIEDMSDEEREVFEEKLNQAMLKARNQKNSVNETAKGLNQFLDEVKKAKDESKGSASVSPSASPAPEKSFLDRLKEMQANITKQTPAPTPQKIELPKMPDEIVFMVSEDAPEAKQEFFAETQFDLGDALVRMDGDAEEFVSVSTAKYQGGYKFELDAFVDADLENGLWPFDSVEGTLVVSFSKVFFEDKKIPVKIKVNHVNIEVKTEAEGESVTSQEETIVQPIEKPPENFKTQDYTAPSTSSYVWPLVGKFSCCSPFGAPRVGHRHQGIDIFAKVGTPIVAPASGVVKSISRADTGLCGLKVSILLDDGTWVANCHLSKVEAYVGQKVRKCEKIGEVGNTGNARTTPSHLHIQFGRPSGNWIDPLKQSNNVLYNAKVNKIYCK